MVRPWPRAEYYAPSPRPWESNINGEPIPLVRPMPFLWRGIWLAQRRVTISPQKNGNDL